MGVSRRTVFLFSLVAGLVVWLGASSGAAAQGPSVVRESDQSPCDPCDVHFVGESHLSSAGTGVIVSVCSDEFEGTINSDGSGEVTSVAATEGDPACNFTSCQDGEEHLPISGLQEVGAALRFTLRVCYRSSGGVQSHCDAEVNVTNVGGHGYRLIMSQLCFNGAARAEGSWYEEASSEEHDDVEFVHDGGGVPVELINEPTGNPCDPCIVHLAGESHVTMLPSGVVGSICEDELLANLYHDGSGELEWVGAPENATGCQVQNCGEAEAHWPAYNLEEVGGGLSRMAVTFCLRYLDTGVSVHCTAEVFIESGEALHVYELSMTKVCVNGTRRIEALWATEEELGSPYDMIELLHEDG